MVPPGRRARLQFPPALCQWPTGGSNQRQLPAGLRHRSSFLWKFWRVLLRSQTRRVVGRGRALQSRPVGRGNRRRLRGRCCRQVQSAGHPEPAPGRRPLLEQQHQLHLTGDRRFASHLPMAKERRAPSGRYDFLPAACQSSIERRGHLCAVGHKCLWQRCQQPSHSECEPGRPFALAVQRQRRLTFGWIRNRPRCHNDSTGWCRGLSPFCRGFLLNPRARPVTGAAL